MSNSKRGYNTMTAHYNTCGWCGKRGYSTRKLAKASRRSQGGNGLHVYPCPRHPGTFHLGHLPQAIRVGDASRDDVYGHLYEQGGAA